jgi:hydrogenase maturation protease
MTEPLAGRVLVAGVGNIFLGDDGFGVEVARRLAGAALPDGVRVADYGTSGMHLAYDLANGYETTILIDAAPRGGPPGTLTVLEVGPEDRPDPSTVGGSPLQGSQLFDAHGMQPDVVFGVLDMLGAQAGRILVVGCQPASVELEMGLSAPVAAAVDEAVRVVTELVTEVSAALPPSAPAARAAPSAPAASAATAATAAPVAPAAPSAPSAPTASAATAVRDTPSVWDTPAEPAVPSAPSVPPPVDSAPGAHPDRRRPGTVIDDANN